MIPKRDHEDEMSMEEILASIRKFVTDNPPEDPNKQRVNKGDLTQQSAFIPTAGHAVNPIEVPVGSAGGVGRAQEERIRQANQPQPQPQPQLQPQPSSQEYQHETLDLASHEIPRSSHTAPVYEPDILELNSPFVSKGTHASSFREASSRGARKVDLEESIMTLTNPIEGKKVDSPPRFSSKPSQLFDRDREEGLVSSHAMAASASSLSRLAQASKSVPRRAPNLADQRDLTIDQLIQDLIRPMIKQWIDTHLSTLVEEMVAKEIRRITKHLG